MRIRPAHLLSIALTFSACGGGSPTGDGTGGDAHGHVGGEASAPGADLVAVCRGIRQHEVPPDHSPQPIVLVFAADARPTLAPRAPVQRGDQAFAPPIRFDVPTRQPEADTLNGILNEGVVLAVEPGGPSEAAAVFHVYTCPNASEEEAASLLRALDEHPLVDEASVQPVPEDA